MGSGHRPEWMNTRWLRFGAGVSTRRYAGTLDSVPAEVTEPGPSGSAVWARFVALSVKRSRSFLSQRLRELDLAVACIDGKVFRDHCMVVARWGSTRGAASTCWDCAKGRRRRAAIATRPC